MADIFISYKAERRRAARHLSRVLAGHGFPTWYDYGLIPGDDFEPRLVAELAQAHAVVVLWCGMSVQSNWVLREARYAREHGKFVPCWIQAAKLPDEFAKADTINLSGWDGAPFSHVLHRLIDDLSRRLRRDPSVSYRTLRDLEDDWRGFGAPSLAQFALSDTLAVVIETPQPVEIPPRLEAALGSLPPGATPNLAAHWERAQRGDATAISEVAYAFQYGVNGLAKDEKEAARLYKIAADLGLAHAIAGLGVMYAQGQGELPKDENEAVRLFRLAADQGDARGQTNLGTAYGRGVGGLPKDDREAARLYKLAADQGYSAGQAELGALYAAGEGGLPKDEREAVRLYALAAEQGDPQGQINLGGMYLEGAGGLPKDEGEAVRLYKLVVEHGNPTGQASLGFMYANGLGGLPKDESEAVRLYQLAAEQGSPTGQAALGWMYSNGLGGLAKDEREAVRLYKLAALGGYDWAQQQLTRLGETW